MSDPKKQWQLLLSRGLANESQLQWAWGQLTPGLDLCEVLLRQSVISPETAMQIRSESELGPSANLYHSLEASASQSQIPMLSGDETVFRTLSKAYLSAKEIEPLFAPHAQHVFRRLGKLGEGGMGVVYRISDQRLGRQAAMKVLKNASSQKTQTSNQNKQLLGRFLREARLTAALDHPCVPAVYELGVNDDREQYMLMRVIEGETLQRRIDEFHKEGGDNPKQLRELLEILLKASETVAFAHFRQIIHRDLKPSNIMVGQFGEVMLMDWGLARPLGDSQSEDSCLLDVEKELSEDLDATQVGSVIGTFGYMPPEQASGERVDEQADVFALGAILTTILTGKPPVLGKTAINRMTATIKGEIAIPSDRQAVPPELDCLAANALESEAADRLESANQFVVNLKAYLLGEELPLFSYGLLERIKRHIRKHPARYVGLSLLAVSALVATLSAIEVARLNSRRQFDNQLRKLTEEKN
ncbi:MAG: serine/threonine-protein kinase, partial [Planctomycetota bacterium]|nr:serine/threonine-protein kinase [Planctomycetota bacterium]